MNPGAYTDINDMQPLSIAMVGIVFDMAGDGLGRHAWELSDEQIVHITNDTFAGEILFALSISFSKIAVLVHYGKIFRAESYTNRAWRWTYYTVLAMTVAWPFATILTDLVKRESSQTVLLSESDDVFGLFPTYIGNAVSSALIDIAILVLPLPPIYTLRLGVGRRLGLALVFILGYS